MIKKYSVGLLIVCVAIETAFAYPAVPASDLPACIDSPSAVAEIQNLQKVHAKTSHKYDGYRRLLGDNPGFELASRLVYAETLAANCKNYRDQIADLIATAIGNRIRIRNNAVDSVVFQRDQFASSLNIYPESRYRDFLCPADGELWQKVVTKMRVALERPASNAAIPPDAVNYYLYRHSARFRPPQWQLEEVAGVDAKVSECIRVFRNPRWK